MIRLHGAAGCSQTVGDVMVNLPAKQDNDPDAELIREVAMDIGKAVVHHIETMYPAMFQAVAGSAKLSVRNTVYNEIMAAIPVMDADAIRARLDERKRHRRRINALRKMRGEV